MQRPGAPAPASAERTPRPREWRPQLYRKCTDTTWLFLFFLFWTGLMFITGYSVAAGATARLLFGYDSFGNVCGKKNSPVEGAPLSGQDMTLKKHVFFMNACNLEVKDVRLSSTILCVSSCPEEQLDTLEEVQLFADNNGSFLCVYSLDSINYTQNPNADSLCPSLPVPPSKSFPLFNRCVPRTPECYSSFASVLINDVDILHRILSGIMSGRDTILGLCILALALSLGMMFTFRFITTLLVQIFIALIISGLLLVCGVLWWLYYDYTHDLSIELDTERENMKCLLGFAIVSTVITAVVLSLIFVFRKRIKLTTELFQVINKAISSSPFLLFQPLWTFAILIFFWVLWVAVLLSLGTAGAAQVIEGGQVEYQPLVGIRYMWWYHLIGLIWTSEFILTCQQMTIAGALVTCYFNRNKNDPPDRPILWSLSILFCYHQGTAIKGSFLMTVTRIPRTILMYLHNTLKDKQHGAWSRCMFRCCFCCFWCLDKCLRQLTQNAYTATAINGTDFCTSAQDVLKLSSKNSNHFTSVNCFGDFIIFLGKVLVVCFTVFGGLMAFNYNRALQVWAIPLLLVAFFAYLVAHCFLSVFETVLDALLLCFAVDMETNDGSSEKPYFMDQEFLSFVKRIDKLNAARAQGEESSLRNEEGTELQAVV
ncbi:choline transporter-like protein 3 isoform X1 [Canis lupus baileyi]|nr:choline transporter-like protein 3 isoform X1 [Canis lupus familiaris]XP_038397206.1 choline transporter-like protein 3 isoform X1 [Canis lupus familiaris]XP_038525986.1 choline transporter-like protein 3 isoform X1 [Canis lupus familiaris]XP_048967605.1 choline transporter-like protein 3 isoform X1 [Canis lupus dingo]|eukprot:XP_005621950.1 choline transporter-like protein 3 isoform X1 [Canis lupus familiaris]